MKGKGRPKKITAEMPDSREVALGLKLVADGRMPRADALSLIGDEPCWSIHSFAKAFGVDPMELIEMLPQHPIELRQGPG